MEKQDKRNKEIALEKTVEDTKKQILEVDMSERKFGQDEDKMIYSSCFLPSAGNTLQRSALSAKTPTITSRTRRR